MNGYNMKASDVTAAKPRLVLIINGGSSSIKFVLFEAGDGTGPYSGGGHSYGRIGPSGLTGSSTSPGNPHPPRQWSEHLPELKIREGNVVDLMKLQP